jgi:hypothetical protein
MVIKAIKMKYPGKKDFWSNCGASTLKMDYPAAIQWVLIMNVEQIYFSKQALWDRTCRTIK